MSKFKGMNAFQLKLLMVFLMFLDHLRYIDNFVSPETASVFTVISRCVAPMFAYFAVEGIIHTHNLKKYCLRLLILAGVIFIGNALLNISNNVIFTLALGVLAIALIQWGKNKPKAAGMCLYAATGICFITGFLWGEWGSVILPFMFTEYFFRDKKAIRFIGYGVIEIIALLLPFGEPLYFFVFPFILLYNGERGPNTWFSKYFFYIFYPVHLWIIAIINLIQIP